MIRALLSQATEESPKFDAMFGVAFIVIGAIGCAVSWRFVFSNERRQQYVADLERQYELSPLPRLVRRQPPRSRFDRFGVWVAAVAAGVVSPCILVVGVAILVRELG
ncbi:MAG: hypothetical protein AB7T37_03010 [Dehalococcoidia bacterium]